MSFIISSTGNLGLMETADLLRQELEAQELLARVSPAVVGSRLARARKRQGLSIRELADAANVNKNSVVRLEKGGMPQPMTVVKVCAALGIHVAGIAVPQDEAAVDIALHRRKDDRWYDLTDFGSGPISGKALSPEDRGRLADKGLSAQMLMLRSRLDAGLINSSVIELYGESPVRSHVGEEMVFVLEGTALVKVGERTFKLVQGESVTFWSAEQHSYAPAPGSELPVRVLSVSVHQQGRRS